MMVIKHFSNSKCRDCNGFCQYFWDWGSFPLQNLRCIVFSVCSILIIHKRQNSFFTMSENFSSQSYCFVLGTNLPMLKTKSLVVMCTGMHTAPWPGEPGLLPAALQGDCLSLSSQLKAKHKDALAHHTMGSWGRGFVSISVASKYFCIFWISKYCSAWCPKACLGVHTCFSSMVWWEPMCLH